MKIDHGIVSAIILSLPLIQEGQLSVSGDRIFTSTGYLPRGLNLQGRHDLIIVLTGLLNSRPTKSKKTARPQ